jgi:hypothetical protein
MLLHFEAPHLFRRKRYVVWSVSLKVGTGDLAFAAGHRRMAISLVAGTLNLVAAFSIAMASSAASTVPCRTALAAILQMAQVVGLGGSGFFAMPASIKRELLSFNPAC